MVINRPDTTYNRTVYNAINRCDATGLESKLKQERMPNGIVICLYKDCFGRHRIVAYKPGMVESCGFSGVLLDPNGVIVWKETNPADRGKGLTRQLCAMLTVWGVAWQPSPYQTQAGKACYKS